jgi:hypothetical protein
MRIVRFDCVVAFRPLSAYYRINDNPDKDYICSLPKDSGKWTTLHIYCVFSATSGNSLMLFGKNSHYYNFKQHLCTTGIQIINLQSLYGN